MFVFLNNAIKSQTFVLKVTANTDKGIRIAF